MYFIYIFACCLYSFRQDQMRGTQDVLVISSHAAKLHKEFKEHPKGTRGGTRWNKRWKVPRLISLRLVTSRHSSVNVTCRLDVTFLKAPTLSQQVMATAARRPGYSSQANAATIGNVMRSVTSVGIR